MQASGFRVDITYLDKDSSIVADKNPCCTLCCATTQSVLYLGRRVITFVPESKSLPATEKKDALTNDLTSLNISICCYCKPYLESEVYPELHSDVAALLIPNRKRQMKDYGLALKQAVRLNMIPMTTLLLDTMTERSELRTKIENRDPNLKAKTRDLDVLEALEESLTSALQSNNYNMTNLLLLRNLRLSLR
ncbi:hypothetical protein [Endozoicomonas atrinae]|uniref:hypothetical protein n=1 Tax=Endozoicomonas atrinae TaxID=1333660 RepID=UPI000A99493C|nr:hypothetical protein [Endozoicomonas atrinae]